jgi:hypothetical protein
MLIAARGWLVVAALARHGMLSVVGEERSARAAGLAGGVSDAPDTVSPAQLGL